MAGNTFKRLLNGSGKPIFILLVEVIISQKKRKQLWLIGLNVGCEGTGCTGGTVGTQQRDRKYSSADAAAAGYICGT